MKHKKKGTPYTPRPTLPPELTDRYAVTMEVLSGRMTVSDGATTLGVSRVQMQTIVHRAQAAMIEGLSPRPSGRPPASEREKALSSEVDRLQRELSRAEQRLQMAEDFLVVASDLVHKSMPRSQSRARSAKKKPTASGTGSNNTGSEPDPATTKEASDEVRRAQADSLLRLRRTKAMPAVVVAKVVGVSEATARRRLRAEREGTALSPRPERSLDLVTREAQRRAEEIVRELPGIGSAVLGRQTGLSRRTAAVVKAATLTAIERERKATSCPVRVTAPGIVRGFDAMHAEIGRRPEYLLVSADGAVPYRTELELVDRYDSAHVAAHLDRDFAVHGAPLVLRYDRASCHRTDEVLDVLAHHQVLPLHGPPRHPRYYGQLERQNREHRPYLTALRHVDRDDARVAIGEHAPGAQHALRTPVARRTHGRGPLDGAPRPERR